MYKNFNFNTLSLKGNFRIMKIVFIYLWMGTLSIWANDFFSQKATSQNSEYNTLQGITINGKVFDTDNVPLPGVSVVIKGSLQGTATDNNGAFTLQVPNVNAILVFSYIGFAGKEIVVGNQRDINITLEEDTRIIDEVVVVGYGTVRKSDLTGAISQIDPTKKPEKLTSNAT